MPGMSGQVPRESVEKHPRLNPLTVTNVLVLFQVESVRTAEGAISIKWECWWVENDLWAWQEKNSDDDSIKSWFQLCGGEKLNAIHQIFLHINYNTVWACHFADECELLPVSTYVGRFVKKWFLISSAFYNTGCTFWNRCSQNYVLVSSRKMTRKYV